MVHRISVGRVVLRILIGALCVAAVVASIALLRGEFSDTDWKVIATSTLFALASAMAAAGIAVRDRFATAVALAAISGAMGVAPLTGLVSDDGDYTLYGEILGVVLVAQLLCTALAPLLRKLDASAERPALEVPTPEQSLASELMAVAERLERLGAGPQVRAECERLRRLARTAATR